MPNITELLDDFKLNQQILGRKPKYIDICSWRLIHWNEFMQLELSIEDVEDVQAIHIKKYIQHRQQLAERVIVMFNDSEVKRIIYEVQEL